MRTRPQVVHVIPIDGIGGVETAARSVLDHADPAIDFRIVLIAGRTIAPDRARVAESPFRSPLNPLALLRALWVCLRSRPDVLIFSLWPSLPLLLLCRVLLPQARHVLFLHLEAPPHVVDRVLSRWATRAADEVWADSAATLEARVADPRKPRRVISFVVNRVAVAGTGETPLPRFVCWCRLSVQKGIDRAIRLIALLRSRGVPASLDVWGPDGGQREPLAALAGELGVADHVRFPGPAARNDLPRVAAGASFFLQLSRAEGMAMGTVEAMQLGLVPVTTAVGEMARYVVDGHNGLIVDPNRLELAADALAALLRDADGYRSLRRSAIERWQSAPTYAEDLQAAVLEACDRSGTAGFASADRRQKRLS